MPRPTCAEIRLDAIQHNLEALRSLLAPGVKVLGVVKADGYGHGAPPVARTLAAGGIDMLGVALVEEGVELREAGVAAPILVMGTIPRDEIPSLVAHDLRPTVCDAEAAREIDGEAARQGSVVQAHLKVDTGMNRLGVRAEAAAETAEAVARLGHLHLEGVYTHFACAEERDQTETWKQLRQFGEVLAALSARKIVPRRVHAANSSALVKVAESHFDMVRPGLALYGVHSHPDEAEKVTLEPALTLRSRVVHLKPVRRGEGVSYGLTWRAERDSLIGVLPIGYGDGYPRALSNRGRVRIGTGDEARLCPVVGRVCMDATMVDLTDVPGARSGLEAALIEADGASPICAARIAEAVGTISYEILTGLSKRVPRRYV